MKSKFNKYWILISVVVIMNIFVFIILSNKLESYVADKMIDDLSADEML